MSTHSIWNISTVVGKKVVISLLISAFDSKTTKSLNEHTIKQLHRKLFIAQ